MLLIVDNDLGFAQFTLETARKLGFKGIITPLGASAIAMASDYQPHAILLDISLPDIDGWRVLDRLKHDSVAAAHSGLHRFHDRPAGTRTEAAAPRACSPSRSKPATGWRVPRAKCASTSIASSGESSSSTTNARVATAS